MAAKILILAGSVRKESFNRRLARLVADAVLAAGGEPTLVELSDYPLPLVNEDLQAEQGVPAPAQQLKQLFVDHPAFVLCCPEYNSGITPLLKNTLDWISRKEGNEPPLVAFKGKVAALFSASPSPLGGLRGLVQVRSLLGNIGVLVLPDQVTVAKAHETFAADGSLKDPSLADRIQSVARGLVEVAGKLK